MTTFKILVLSPSASSLIPNIAKLLPDNEDIIFYDNGEIDDADIILIHYSYYLKNKEKLNAIKRQNPKVAILANFSSNDVLDEILRELQPYHLFGLTDLNALSDIKDFILFIFNKSCWTPDMFVPKVINDKEDEIIDSFNLHEKIETNLSFFDFSNCFSGFKDYVIQVMNELLTNALYNAPVDGQGVHLYRDMNRSEAVTMLPGKEISLKIFENNDKLVISIKDQFGSLCKDDIDDFINNNKVINKDGGAGVGIYLSFRHCHKLIFLVDKGNSTEVIIVFNKFKRFKQYSLVDKSFHYFII